MKTKANNLSATSLISDIIQSTKKTSIKTLLLVLFFASIMLIAILIVNIVYHVPFAKMTSDTASIGGIHPLSGVLSNLGIVVWCVAASCCALAAAVLRSRGPKNLYTFLLYSSLLSAFLMFDDLFQFHEDLSGDIGLNQKVVYVLYGLSIVSYLIYFRRILLKTNVIPFLIALACLFSSIVVDTVVYKLFGDQLGDWLDFIEDGVKWIGIVFWCYYFFYTSYQFIIKNTEISNATN